MDWDNNFDFRVLESQKRRGLYVASGGNYDKLWIRDNCQIAYSLFKGGYYDQAREIVHNLLQLLNKYNRKIYWVIKEGKPSYEDNWKLLHPVYQITGEEINQEWGWNQNDAWGLLLFCADALENHFKGFLSKEDKRIIQELVEYLLIVRFWEADNGIWEEESMVNSVSIATCLRGLEKVRRYAYIPQKLFGIGSEVYSELVCDTRISYSQTRNTDLSLLQLVYPLNYASDPKTLIEDIEYFLVREKGVIRYHRDRYEASDHGLEEAQWPLGLLWLGLAWGQIGRRDKANEYWIKANALRTDEGFFPESYHRVTSGEKEAYEPCPHTPLTWAHAFAIALRSFIAD